jgi:AbrB family looped-hinge helix DNA binding protein
MHKLAIATIVIALIALIVATPVYAEAYNAILEDENLRITLYYPPEVKVSSCYNFRFEAQAFSLLTIDKIRLVIKMYRDSVTEKLYDEVLFSGSVGSGWTFSKNIVICIPTPRRPDPFLGAEIYAEYTLNDLTTKKLSTEWYMSIVRTKTYDELLSELDEARRWIRYLEEKISKLDDYIKKLEGDLSTLSSSYNKLSSDYNSLQTSYKKLQDDYVSLQQKYMSLQDEFKNLSEDYRKLLIDYEKLRTLYEQLMDNNKQLQSNYNSLREDYTSLSKEHYKLQGIYQDLTERYNDLKSRYESSINTIGQLQSTISNLEQAIREKEERINELNLIYTSTANENTLTKSILYAQTAAIAGVGAGIYIMSLRKKRTTYPATQLPPPPPAPPPPTTIPKEEEARNSGNSRIQKILSGRRITLPKDALEKLNIKEGGKVKVELYDGYVKIVPVKEEIEGNAQ